MRAGTSWHVTVTCVGHGGKEASLSCPDSLHHLGFISHRRHPGGQAMVHQHQHCLLLALVLPLKNKDNRRLLPGYCLIIQGNTLRHPNPVLAFNLLHTTSPMWVSSYIFPLSFCAAATKPSLFPQTPAEGYMHSALECVAGAGMARRLRGAKQMMLLFAACTGAGTLWDREEAGCRVITSSQVKNRAAIEGADTGTATRRG